MPFLPRFLFKFHSLIAQPESAQGGPGSDSTGLPGDNFSLQGALEMFKKASSPEDFEKLINTKDNAVNNLDLNDDGDIDYVRVIDKSENDVHAFILQVPVSESENQDIAVIELEKTGDTTVAVQIVGDEDIYGEEIIMEPDAGGDGASVNDGNAGMVYGQYPDYFQTNARIVVNVWRWPSVRYVYRPGYAAWHSPWRWHHYPGWWRPWRPYAWHVYHPMRIHYHGPFVVANNHRLIHAHRLYTPVRVTSIRVKARYQTSITKYRISRPTVIGPKGNRVSRTTTTVRGNNKAKTTRTTVRKRR